MHISIFCFLCALVFRNIKVLFNFDSIFILILYYFTVLDLIRLLSPLHAWNLSDGSFVRRRGAS